MKNAWLRIFNLVTFVAWSMFFLHAIQNGLCFDSQSLMMLNIAQGLAVFEIMNAIIGIAGANWLLTAAQVFSRLLIVVLLNWIPAEQMEELGNYSGFSVVTVAWSITEIVRALFYLSELSKRPSTVVTYSRYTFFIFLYPIGVMGEFMVMYSFWEWRHFELNAMNLFLVGVALSYFVFFPKLYGHMWKQRKKKLTD